MQQPSMCLARMPLRQALKAQAAESSVNLRRRECVMTSKETLRKTVAIVLAACFAALAGTAFAGNTADQAGKVDCKQYPNDPECKGKTQ
jgi:hypothetical protein